MKSVRQAVEDYREVGYDEASDKVTFTPARRNVSVLAIVGKWAMVRRKGDRPHICDVADLTPNVSNDVSEGSEAE